MSPAAQSGERATLTAEVRRRPDDPDAHYRLGLELLAAGASWAAVTALRAALRLRVSDGQIWLALGHALQGAHRFEDAADAYRQAARLGLDGADLHVSLGLVLAIVGQRREALVEYRRALAHAPGDPAILSLIGLALVGLGRMRAALKWQWHVLSLAPDWFGSYGNLGLVLLRMHRLDEAQSCFEHAVALAPDCIEARYNLSLVHLIRGDYPRGFADFDAHLKLWVQRFDERRWRGEPLDGRTLLLVAHNGLGDTLQFIRYLPRVKALGGRVIVQVQPALRALLDGVEGADEVIGRASPVHFDVQASLLELPRLFGDRLDTIPRATSYLAADAARREKWARRLGDGRALKVGIAWHGNPHQLDGLYRSCRLRDFAPLAGVPNVQLYSLQKNAGSEQLDEPGAPRVHDFGDELDADAPFVDTAALMCALDLVVTIDTSIAHLAGALGRPVWIVLPDWADWRWMLSRADSPWYPTARLFRQARPFDWASAFHEVQRALMDLTRATVDKETP